MLFAVKIGYAVEVEVTKTGLFARLGSRDAYWHWPWIRFD